MLIRPVYARLSLGPGQTSIVASLAPPKVSGTHENNKNEIRGFDASMDFKICYLFVVFVAIPRILDQRLGVSYLHRWLCHVRKEPLL